MTVQYVTVADIQAHLNASYDAGSLTYTVFGLSVSEASFLAHVDFANLYVNSIVGFDLQTSDPRYNWARLAALNLACLRVLVAASGGMLLGSYDYQLGDLVVTRAPTERTAFENAINSCKDDLLRMLMNFATPVIAAEASAKDEVPTYRGGLVNP
jgi:hypothetical protein